MRLILLLTILCVSIVSNSYAQRVKYKNVFPLLQSKDYKSAEPLLLQFLDDNDDEANAYFYLGEITTSKLDTVEIFPSTEKYDSVSDLAIESYKKAIALVDDREVRKNDDYYMAYNRRDLRTGKFGIKTSDVHLDYENKIADVVSKKKLINELHRLNEDVINQYDNLKNKMVAFYSSYPDESSFKLRANDEDRKSLAEVRQLFNDFKTQYTTFTEKLNSLNHPAYTASIAFIPISRWDELTPREIDFSNFKIGIQDYDSYLTAVDQKIESEVQPVKELLYKTDSDFNSALKVNGNVKDSAQIKEMNIPAELKEGLAKLDSKNVIYSFLQYKKLKNSSILTTNNNLFPVLADSSNIYQRTNLVKKYKNRLSDQLDLIIQIEKEINDRIKTDFAIYFDGFEPSIDAYIRTERTILEQKFQTVSEKSKEMEIDIQYFNTELDTIYTTPLNAAANNGDKYILSLIESDSSLLLAGNWLDQPFVANAGFDMKIKSHLVVEDTTFAFKKILDLDDRILFILNL